MSNKKQHAGIGYRLSPNEEARILKEAREERRKQRLIQVRQQSKTIAAKIRKAVKDEEKKQLQNLANQIQYDWEQEKAEKIRVLEEQYHQSLQNVGEAHMQAALQEPQEPKRALLTEVNQQRAKLRHQAALEKQRQEKQEKEEKERRHILARQAAIEEERQRAAEVAARPPPPPDPVDDIQPVKGRPVKFTDLQAFSSTHLHIPDVCHVEKAQASELEADARASAQSEAEKQEDLLAQQKRLKFEQREKARLRHNHALKKEILKQDYEHMLHDLSDLQRADHHRRQNIVDKIPKQIFVAPHRRVEEKQEAQRDMEQAFEDMYMAATEFMGDLSLALDPHPPPETPTATESLDLSVLDSDPVDSEVMERSRSSGPPALQDITNHQQQGSSGKTPDGLKRLISRIKSQRENHWTQKPTAGPTEVPQRPAPASRPGAPPSLSQHSITATSQTASSQTTSSQPSESAFETTQPSESSRRSLSTGPLTADTGSLSEGALTPSVEGWAEKPAILHPLEQAERLRSRDPKLTSDLTEYLSAEQATQAALRRDTRQIAAETAERQRAIAQQRAELEQTLANIDAERNALMQKIINRQQQQQQQLHNTQQTLSRPHESLPPQRISPQPPSLDARELNGRQPGTYPDYQPYMAAAQPNISTGSSDYTPEFHAQARSYPPPAVSVNHGKPAYPFQVPAEAAEPLSAEHPRPDRQRVQDYQRSLLARQQTPEEIQKVHDYQRSLLARQTQFDDLRESRQQLADRADELLSDNLRTSQFTDLGQFEDVDVSNGSARSSEVVPRESEVEPPRFEALERRIQQAELARQAQQAEMHATKTQWLRNVLQNRMIAEAELEKSVRAPITAPADPELESYRRRLNNILPPDLRAAAPPAATNAPNSFINESAATSKLEDSGLETYRQRFEPSLPQHPPASTAQQSEQTSNVSQLYNQSSESRPEYIPSALRNQAVLLSMRQGQSPKYLDSGLETQVEPQLPEYIPSAHRTIGHEETSTEDDDFEEQSLHQSVDKAEETLEEEEEEEEEEEDFDRTLEDIRQAVADRMSMPIDPEASRQQHNDTVLSKPDTSVSLSQTEPKVPFTPEAATVPKMTQPPSGASQSGPVWHGNLPGYSSQNMSSQPEPITIPPVTKSNENERTPNLGTATDMSQSSGPKSRRTWHEILSEYSTQTSRPEPVTREPPKTRTDPAPLMFEIEGPNSPPMIRKKDGRMSSTPLKAFKDADDSANLSQQTLGDHPTWMRTMDSTSDTEDFTSKLPQSQPDPRRVSELTQHPLSSGSGSLKSSGDELTQYPFTDSDGTKLFRTPDLTQYPMSEDSAKREDEEEKEDILERALQIQRDVERNLAIHRRRMADTQQIINESASDRSSVEGHRSLSASLGDVHQRSLGASGPLTFHELQPDLSRRTSAGGFSQAETGISEEPDLTLLSLGSSCYVLDPDDEDESQNLTNVPLTADTVPDPNPDASSSSLKPRRLQLDFSDDSVGSSQHSLGRTIAEMSAGGSMCRSSLGGEMSAGGSMARSGEMSAGGAKGRSSLGADAVIYAPLQMDAESDVSTDREYHSIPVRHIEDSASDDPTNAPVTLQDAFLHRKRDFISKSARRQEEAKEKAKSQGGARQSRGKGTLGKTLASWKRSRGMGASGAASAAVRPRDPTTIVERSSADRARSEQDSKTRTSRLYSRLEEVQKQKVVDDRRKFYAENREKAKEYHKKQQEKLKKKQQKK